MSQNYNPNSWNLPNDFNYTFTGEPTDVDTIVNQTLIRPGETFPPHQHIERIARYEYLMRIFEARKKDVFKRASELLKDTPYHDQLDTLYLSVNLADVIASKPAELLMSQLPIFESGLDPKSAQQMAINRIVEDNNLYQLIFNMVVNAAIKGDSFVKAFYNYRQDYSELYKLQRLYPDANIQIPKNAKPELVIESVNPSYVFPEMKRGSTTEFKGVNIAYVEWLETDRTEYSMEYDSYLYGRGVQVPLLYVEKHVPGYVIYERYLLRPKMVNDIYGVNIPVFEIMEQIPTGRKDGDVVATGVDVPLVFHFGYKTVEHTWQGIGAIEKIADMLIAASDRLTELDWILHKHSDPILTGPHLDGNSETVRLGGAYISQNPEDPPLQYVTWDGKLDAAFKQLEMILGFIFTESQLPQWLFGTSLTNAQQSGGGSSHTDSTGIKMRYAPVSALISRISMNLQKTVSDVVYYSQMLENYSNEGVPTFEQYEPVYPKVIFSDGIPRNDREQVEIMALRINSKLIDQRTAIKRLDGVDDDHASEMIERIVEDDKRMFGTMPVNGGNAGGSGDGATSTDINGLTGSLSGSGKTVPEKEGEQLYNETPEVAGHKQEGVGGQSKGTSETPPDLNPNDTDMQTTPMNLFI
jgi:hypothetical protein